MAMRHLEAVACRSDGSFSCTSSTLTGNVWDGGLWFFDNWEHYKQIPNLDMYVTATHTGISDIKWYNNLNLIAATDSGDLEIWQLIAPGNELENKGNLAAGHDEMVLCVGVTCEGEEEGRRVISGGADGRVILWDMITMKYTKSYKGHVGWLTSLDTHPTQSNVFITVGMDSHMKLWDVREPSLVTHSTAPPTSVGNYQSVAWSLPDEFTIAAGGESGCVNFYDTRSFVKPTILTQPHTRDVHRVSFSPVMKGVLASVSDDFTVHVYDSTSQSVMLSEKSHEDFVHGLSWQHDGSTLLTCGWDGKVVHHTLDINTTEIIMKDECKVETNPKRVCGNEEKEILPNTTNDIERNKVTYMETEPLAFNGISKITRDLRDP